jgi:DNA-binding NtrC family response regulator
MPDALKVMLVEDDPAVRFGAVQALRLAALDVAQFETAEAALAALHPYFPGVLSPTSICRARVASSSCACCSRSILRCP